MDVAQRAAAIAAFVGGLADAGVATAFVSPGSRSAPVTAAIGIDPRVDDHAVRDERSAAFAALGLAKATGRPAAVVCTSGTAAGNYLPAVMEAWRARVPMIVITADRPSRLRHTGAPQTADQFELYGSHAVSFTDLDITSIHDPRSTAIDVAHTAVTKRGPAHVNMPLDEPLVPAALPAPPAPADVAPPLHRHTSTRIPPLPRGERVMITVGGRLQPETQRAVLDLATRSSAVVIADPQSNLSGEGVLRNGDLLASMHDAAGRRPPFASQTPDLVLRVGPIPTSKGTWTWLERGEVDQVWIDDGPLEDPLGSATVHLNGDIASILDELPYVSRDAAFRDAWAVMDDVAGAAAARTIDGFPFPSEPAIARIVAASVPASSALWLASSRPIRDVDAFAPPRSDIDVLANRGVNGIDGTIASAMGAAMGGVPTTLLIGDVAALHDATALGEAARLGAPLRAVVVNNDGGGIFDFLPYASTGAIPEDVFTRNWSTPHGLSLVSIARSLGMAARRLSAADALASALSAPIEEPELIELTTHREVRIAQERAIHEAVAEAVSSLPGCPGVA